MSVAVFLGLKKWTKPAYYLNLAFLGFQIVIGMLFAGLSIVYAPGGTVLAYEFFTVVTYVLVYVNPNLIYFMNRRALFSTSDE